MAKIFNRRYKIIHPHLIGLPERETDYVLEESRMGYSSFIKLAVFIGLPKSIVEHNPELYKRIEDDLTKI